MNKQLVIEKNGIPFVIDPELQQWVKTTYGSGYVFHELESIVSVVIATLPCLVHRVELYGVAQKGRLYVKQFNSADN